jgi:hypothetical protein
LILASVEPTEQPVTLPVALPFDRLRLACFEPGQLRVDGLSPSVTHTCTTPVSAF